MANIFAITTANDSIKLNAERHGEAVFTVTDTTARPLRGLAKLRPLGDTKQEWLKLAGENERDFAAGSTQQFTVMLDVPANIPAGKYGFRLDIISVINPDEDFVEGPTVTAELLPPKPPAPSKAWMIPLALIVLLLIGGAIALIATRTKTVKVPSVEGQKIEQAHEMLTKAQLQFTEVKVPAADPSQVGKVKSVLPKPGESVEVNSSVALEFYVTGKIVVKKVLGLTLEQAKQILEGDQHLLAVDSGRHPVPSLEFSLGQVEEQDPAAGATVDPGTPVKLTIAGDTIRVPSGITGQPLDVAINRIDSQLTISLVGQKLDDKVIKVDPAENTPVLKGSRITIYLPQDVVPCPTPQCKRLEQVINVSNALSFSKYRVRRAIP